MLEKDKTSDIVSLSPHCYHTMKNDQPYLSANLNVQHYTQTLFNAIEKGTLILPKRVERKVVFHDPCYLGRYNGIYDEPRKILESIEGLKLMEFYRNRRMSHCCGGGSGRVLTEEPPYAERPAIGRVKEAMEIGADTIATACPLCLIQLTSATKSLDVENHIMVKDIIELISEAL